MPSGTREKSERWRGWPPALLAGLLAAALGGASLRADAAAAVAAPPPTDSAVEGSAGPRPAATLDAATRCMAMVAYAEAAGEGVEGLAAVIRVIRNRMVDARFPKDACDVVRAAGEFQPVGDSARLRQALAAPEAQDMAAALVDFGPVDTAVLAEAVRLAQSSSLAPGADPTGGALYFVNPRFMEPAKCPWFADLKRTGEIGQHVFMTHYEEGDAAAGPALDCAQVRQYWAAFVKDQAARGKRVGKRRVNPAWLVKVDPSGLATGKSCQVGTYDPTTRTYSRAQGC